MTEQNKNLSPKPTATAEEEDPATKAFWEKIGNFANLPLPVPLINTESGKRKNDGNSDTLITAKKSKPDTTTETPAAVTNNIVTLPELSIDLEELLAAEQLQVDDGHPQPRNPEVVVQIGYPILHETIRIPCELAQPLSYVQFADLCEAVRNIADIVNFSAGQDRTDALHFAKRSLRDRFRRMITCKQRVSQK